MQMCESFCLFVKSLLLQAILLNQFTGRFILCANSLKRGSSDILSHLGYNNAGEPGSCILHAKEIPQRNILLIGKIYINWILEAEGSFSYI